MDSPNDWLWWQTWWQCRLIHKFRTTLELIISPLEKLQCEVKDEQVSETLSALQRNAIHLRQLINELPDISKPEWRQPSCAQTNETENLFLKKIYNIVEEMIDDPQLGASKLAERNAMSLRTLNRKLDTMIGLTACDLIRQYRLQKSLVLLKSGHHVAEAAYMVGFETPAYFSQCFKEQYGVSPKDYFTSPPPQR